MYRVRREASSHADRCDRAAAAERDSVSLSGDTQQNCTGQPFLWLIVAISCISGLLFG
jgi:hypothetical protein